METIKKLKEEIEILDKGCKAKKQYTDCSVRFYTCGRMTKCQNCKYLMIENEAKLETLKEVLELIDEKIKRCKTPFCPVCRSLEELKQKIIGGSIGCRKIIENRYSIDPEGDGWVCGQFYDALKKVILCDDCKDGK